MRRCSRPFTAVLVVLSLLFSQLALANYVCPSEAAQAEAGMDAMVMADGQPCEGMDTGVPVDQAQAVLCHQHCLNAPQSLDAVKLPTVSLPAVVHVLIIPLVMDEATAHSTRCATVGEPRPPPAPLFLSTLRLRI
ncbi:hypothetical protein [uncultured Ramlibacter sp.]|uniref:hypothetical protein n=1 Tax=uncultured Ramlibacter sp. TaxID=260755 RepID=UPI0026338081|nr:hypothetical protein [uncultured Ramlibacter sp.]